MLNATIKRLLILLTIATIIGLAGCSNPEEKRAKALEDALEQFESGDYAGALAILESLSAEYPNDTEILRLIGNVYFAEGDYSSAAFFLERAHLQEPDNVDLLYKTYQALKAGGQPTGPSLEKLIVLSPETMTNTLWVELGEYRSANNQIEPALEAYLKGVNPDEQRPNPETAAAIGQLFAKLGNEPQAIKWLEIAADNDDPSALTALFALLEIQLHKKQWVDAERTIARLDQQFPGAVEASPWKPAGEELKRWRASQEKMKAELAAAEAAKKAEAEAAKKAAALAKAQEKVTEIPNETTSEGKSQIITDLEAAEAMANKPAQERPDAVAIEAGSNENDTIAFDPDIAIEPADPDLTFAVTFDEQDNSPSTNFSVETTDNLPPTVTAEEEDIPAIRPAEQPKTLEELLQDAQTAEIERDYKSAIRKYWAAISIANNRPDVWNLLSRAYLVDGQVQNAETAALEAVRLKPREVAYTLDYLRVAQRSRKPKDFLAQLETAYDRFPSSPEITLSLARAHERINKDEFVARNLYLRFIDIAPNHPLVPEAEKAVERLR